MSAGTGGNYMPKVLALALCGMLEPGTANSILVRHDPWCAIHKDLPCDCDPDVSIQPAADALAVRPDNPKETP